MSRARTSAPLVKVNLPCGKVQTGIGKVDPARKLKCTTAARERERKDIVKDNSLGLFLKLQSKCGTLKLFEIYYFLQCSTLQYIIKQSVHFLVHCTVQYIFYLYRQYSTIYTCTGSTVQSIPVKCGTVQ